MSSSTDSPAPGEPAAKVGYVRRAHGIKGALVVRAPEEELVRFVPGAVFMTDHADFPELSVRSVQNHKDGLLIGVTEVSDRTSAEGLKGTSLLVAERRSLEDDEFWPEQLVGLTVVDPGGNGIGAVADVVATPAQDRLVVTTADGDFEVPFVAALFTSVDLDAGVMVLDAPEGLLEA